MPHGVMGDLMADDQCQFISGPYKMQQARRHDDLPAIGVRVHSVLVPQPYGVWTAAYAGDRERTFRAVLLDHDVERRRARTRVLQKLHRRPSAFAVHAFTTERHPPRPR